MTELSSGFETNLQRALLDDVEQRTREEIAPTVQAHAHGILSAYGSRHDYDVASIIEAGTTRVERRKGRVLVRFGWPEPAIFLERGTVDHGPKNAEVLSWVWEDPPQWVRDNYDREGKGWRVFLSEVEGLPESRFIRDSLNYVRRRFES